MNVDEYNAQIAAGMSEAKLQELVVAMAKTLGWRHVFHVHDARRGLGKGFPDLCMVRRGRVVFVELKTMKGRLSSEQKSWRDELSSSDAEWYCWRPDALLSGEVESVLQ